MFIGKKYLDLDEFFISRRTRDADKTIDIRGLHW